jgi:hypothetical protein
MAENNQYWNQLISDGIRSLQERNNDAAAAVLKKADFDVEHTYHDSWRWGTDYWELVLSLKNKDYMALGDKKDQAERDIMSALVPFQKGSRDLLSTVSIRPVVEQIMDWNDAIPFQKAAEDAELLMREGKYDIAVDRVLTALSDYTKHLLAEHDVPSDEDDRVRTILQSVGEIIDAMAHTDGQPVGKREGQFALGLINLVVEYIEDVEKGAKQ